VFLKVIDWFNKVPRVFSRCFRPKIGLFIKQTLGLFFQPPQRLDSRDFEMTRRLLIQDDWGSTSLVTFFKKIKARVLGLDLASSTWVVA